MDELRRPVIRLRRIIGAWSIFAIVTAGAAWMNSIDGSIVVCDAIAWMKSYRGCMCDDCCAECVGFMSRRHGCQMQVAGWCDPSVMAPRLFAAGWELGEVALFGTRPLTRLCRHVPPASGVCPKCGYPLADLPTGSPCPECGSQ